MKSIKTIFAAVAILAGSGAIHAVNPQFVNTSVGPVVAGSINNTQLPKKATKYIESHFKTTPVKSAEREFLSGEYNVVLSDGVDLEFNSKGKIMEIDAPEGYVFNEDVLHSILPSQAVKTLKKRGVAEIVNTIKRTDNGYTVEIPGDEDFEYQFDSYGRLLCIAYE